MGFAGFIVLGLLGCGGALPAGDGAPTDTATGHETSADSGIPGEPTSPEPCPRHIAPPAAPSTHTPDALVPRRLATDHRTGRCLAVDDLDRDGAFDILTITRAQGEGPRQRLEVWWGDGTHTATPLDGLPHPNDSCTPSDLDGDGDLDLLTGDGARIIAVENRGDRSWETPEVLLEFGEAQDWLDLVALHVTDVGPDALYLAAECAALYDAALARGSAAATDRTVSWGATAQDFDLDGDLDVFATVSVAVGPGGFTEPICEMADRGYAAPGPMLHVAEGDGAFTHLTLQPGEGTPAGQWYAIVAATGDVDGDGDVDVVTSSGRAGLHVWENRAERAGAWLGIRPLEAGAVSIGARVVVRQAGGERMHDLYGTFGTGGHSELRAWFGLGPEPGSVQVDVRWPDGTWSTWPRVAVDQRIDLDREAVPPPVTGR